MEHERNENALQISLFDLASISSGTRNALWWTSGYFFLFQ